MTNAAASFSVPRIRTARLLLREHQAKDFEPYAAQMADPETTKYMSGVVNRRTAWRLFLTGAGSWIVNGSGWLTIELTESSEVIGTVGAFFRETSLNHGRDADLELGWILYRPFWSRGFAKEAAAALLAFAVGRHDPKRVVAHIASGNVASVRVSEAIGMKFAGETDFYGERSNFYAIDRR